MISWEKATRVEGPSGACVVRAYPTDVSPVMAPAAGALFYVAIEKLRQRFRRDQPWTVTVHRAVEDRNDPALISESYPSRKSAMEAAERLGVQLRSHGLETPS